MHKFIFLLGILVKNYRIFIAYRNLLRTEYADEANLKCIQEKKLRSLIRRARVLSPMYEELLNGIEISNVSLESLDRMNIMSKAKLREINVELTHNKSHKFGYIKSETSGTSGEAFLFYRDYWWDAYHRAAIYRGMRQFGVQPWEYNMYLWGFIFSRKERLKTVFLDWLQNRFRIFHFESIDERLDKKLRKVKYVSGYASVINSLAEKAILQNRRYGNVKFIKGTSEKIYPNYKNNTSKVFGVSMISEYGAAECGIIAFECTEGNMHVQRENVILEEIGGRAIVTNLNSHSLPIIRFDLGDYITLVEKNCTCGRHGQIVSEVLGRVGKDIIGKQSIYPSLTLYYVFKDLALQNGFELSYCAEQHVVGELKVFIYSSRELEEVTKQIILTKFKRYFTDDVDVDILLGDISNRKEKLSDFISFL